MTYRTEFPDFESAIPDIFLAPPWVDNSWHNDACPSFTLPFYDGRGLTVYVDEADPAKRGIEPAGPRFCVFHSDQYGAFENDAAALESDDLQAILAYIAQESVI
jgi:hypothetical protein